ncbi:MAG: hypothetical protein WBG48_18230, partial [Pricia sp.]
MEKDNLDKLFEDLRGTFDVEAPAVGHEQRFLEKLEALKAGATGTSRASGASGVSGASKLKTTWWKPLAVAASIALLCTLGYGLYQSPPTIEEQVAEISPEVSRTQYY